MNEPRWTLEAVTFHWGDAYLVSYTCDRWVALRRDTHQFVTADTLDRLEAAMRADYEHQPVPRDFDPPGTAEEMTWSLVPAICDTDEVTGDDDGLDADTVTIVRTLRQAFPLWAITYSRQTRAWIARTHGKTICEASAALLCIALTLIERRERQAGNGTSSPGWDGPAEP
jgi:hypothetical protein